MKKLTHKQKKVLNIIVTSLQICIVLLAVVLSIIILVNPNITSGEVGRGGIKLLPVLTESMNGDKKDSFKAGDLVIATRPKDADLLKEGDIVTFAANIDGRKQLNTHRIVKKDIDQKGEIWFNTRGDNTTRNDDGFIYADDVLAVYKFHIKGIGKAIFWLQHPTNFLLVIELPLIALFIYNIILFVKMLMQVKINKLAEEQQESQIDEEEIKRRAIEEYLASQKVKGENE